MIRSATVLGQLPALMVISSAALAQESPGAWRQSVVLHGMGAAIDGEASVGPLNCIQPKEV